MKKLLLITAWWLLCGTVVAQDGLETNFVADTQEEYDEMFSELDWDKIPTGVLIDKALIFSDLEKFNGINEELSAANFSAWQQLYVEYYNASRNREGLITRATISESAHAFMKEEQKIPLLFLGFQYNKFVPDAVDQGLLLLDSLNTKKILDNSGTEQLYTEGQVFAITSASPGWNGGQVTFYINRQFWFGNMEVPDYVEIDFDDGQGYRIVQMDSEVEINYGQDYSAKQTTVKFLIVETGAVLYGKGELMRKTATPPDLIYGLKATTAWNGKNATALAYVQWGNGNTSGPTQNKFCKPLIFVEGIDFQTNTQNSIYNTIIPAYTGIFSTTINSQYYFNCFGYRNGDTGWDEMIDYNPKIPDIQELPELRRQLQADGYDIIFLDFSDGSGLLQENAMVFVELLEWINSNKACNNEAVVVAASMGGQVARFGLTWMEQNNRCHNTKLYISIDSPHKGANIPLGPQFMAADMASATSGDAKRNLQRPATMQMLLMNFDDNNAAPLRNVWQAWQASANSYPIHLRKVAVANGSKIGTTLPAGPGSEIIETNWYGSLVVGNKHTYTLNGVQKWRRNNIIYHDQNGLTGKKEYVQANSSWPHYDTAPGGRYRIGGKFFNEWAETSPVGGQGFHKHQDDNTFMPTISTLDVRAAYGNSNLLLNVDLTYNVFANIIDNQPDPIKYAFDAYYAPTSNEYHVQITPANIAWMRGQMQINQPNHPDQLSSLFNLGSPVINRLKTVTIQSGGELYINKIGAATGVTPAAQAQPGIFQVSTAGGCPVYVRLNSNGTVPGKMVLGDDTDANYKAEVTFKKGSTLELNGGKLVINNNSRLVIEEGATLLLSQNSIIELNGINSILEIKGNLIIGAGVTFTFTKASNQPISGFIRLNMPSWSQRTINVTPTSRIELRGLDKSDKILELTSDTYFNTNNWNMAGYIIENGRVEMGLHSKLYLFGPAIANNVDFIGDNTARYKTVEAYVTGHRITNCLFYGAEEGLTTMNNAGEQLKLTNGIFSDCFSGLKSLNGHLTVENCEFLNNSTGWAMHGGNTSVVSGNWFDMNSIGIEYYSASGRLDAINSTFTYNGEGITFIGSGILSGRCSKFIGNDMGIHLNSNAYLDLSQTVLGRPAMEFSNTLHNLYLISAAGLNLQNGANKLRIPSSSSCYVDANNNTGTSAIIGTIHQDVYQASHPHYNPNRTFNGNNNLWNYTTSGQPRSGDCSGPTFDYNLTGVNDSNPFTIIDNNPLNPNVQILDCYTQGVRMASSSNQDGGQSINSRQISPLVAASPRYIVLTNALQQAKGLRKIYNPNGNDLHALAILHSVLKTAKPDTSIVINELLSEAYRLMADTYSAALVTDKTSSMANKLLKMDEVTNKLLSWQKTQQDPMLIYRTLMDRTLQSYAAGDLNSAQSRLMQVRALGTVANNEFVQYWDCLISSSLQLRDSLITTSDFFEVLDNCRSNGNSSRSAKLNNSGTQKGLDSNSALKLYPNPASESVKISFILEEPEQLTIELVDVNGTVLKSKNAQTMVAGSQEFEFNITNQKTGLYFIRVYGKYFNQSSKLSIVK